MQALEKFKTSAPGEVARLDEFGKDVGVGEGEVEGHGYGARARARASGVWDPSVPPPSPPPPPLLT